MFRRYSRIIAAVVVCFFTWTSGGVFPLAHAAVDAVKKGKEEPARKKGESPEERFQKATDDLREALADKKVDLRKKKELLKLKKAEIEAVDPEIKKEFAETEKRLKAVNLPPEIMERHRRFVKHYDDNLAELKGSIDRVEKARDNKKAETEMEKVGMFLEKTKAPSRHHKLDPNNLPFRQPKAIKREPRMNKEEFEKELKRDKNAWRYDKRIMVASNGSLAGLLTSAGMLLPTAADLAETIEVQLTPEIRAKALELGNNPVKIYEWVKNNIEFVPTWGSIQGANMTLLTRQGNAFDTSSLLIALLRAAGVHAHYVTGTIELPIEKIMNWAGGFTDPTAALNFIASGGMPVTGLRSGGKVVSARMEHVWVKAWVDMVPSQGAMHKQGDTWVPLDASFKRYNYADGVDFQSVVPFDGQSFADQLKATATVNEQESYVTNVNSTTIQSALTDYNTRLENYVSQNLPNATAADILGKKEIVRKEQAILPASLPYKVVITGTETSEVPASYRHKIRFEIVGGPTFDEYGELISTAGLSYTSTLPYLAGKRVTVSFDPATPADKAVIDTYASQQATTLPAYMIRVVPTLRIDNVIVATGPSIGMGSEQPLSITISSLNDSQMVTHNLYAGDYTAIGINPSKIGLDVLQNRIDRNDFSEPVGEMLHQTALSYWGEADAFNDVIAKTIGVRNLRHPSELAATSRISLSWLWGIRAYGTYKSRNIDIKLDNQTVMAKAIDKAKEFAYMQQSGMNSSFLEGAVLDQLFGKNIGDSISAVNALKLANDQGIPIYNVNASNVASVLPKLQLSDEIKNEVANAVNAGLTVQIPKTTITQLGWTGVGYIISNPIDGTGAYRISGGLNGGDSPAEGTTVIPIPQIPLTGPICFVVGGLLANSGMALLTESCSAVAVAIPIATILTVFIVLLLIVALIVAVIKTMPPRYRIYRHYTSVAGKLGILSPPYCIKISDWRGDMIFTGTYITDLIEIEPDTFDHRMFIAKELGIPYERTETYVQMKIDRNRELLFNYFIIFPRQYLYPFRPLCHQPPTIQFEEAP
jgi:hypothetical protein